MQTKSLQQFKNEHSLFFKNGRGKNERYNVYKGCLLVTAVNEFTEKTETKVYEENSAGALIRTMTRNSVSAAKRAIEQKMTIAAMTDSQLANYVLLNLPLVGLESLIELLPQNVLGRLAESLCNMAEDAARKSEYIYTANYHHDHQRAVKAQNKQAEKVREALGYSYPKQDINF